MVAPLRSKTMLSLTILIPHVDSVYRHMVATNISILKFTIRARTTEMTKRMMFIPRCIAPCVTRYTTMKVGRNVRKNVITLFPKKLKNISNTIPFGNGRLGNWDMAV